MLEVYKNHYSRKVQEIYLRQNKVELILKQEDKYPWVGRNIQVVLKSLRCII